MEKTNFLLAMTKPEKQALQKIANKFGFSLSEYMRKKLFNENTDLANPDKNCYISISAEKHEILSISILYKLLYLQRELIEKQGSSEEIAELDKRALEYARKQRDMQGYKIIEKNHE